LLVVPLHHLFIDKKSENQKLFHPSKLWTFRHLIECQSVFQNTTSSTITGSKFQKYRSYHPVLLSTANAQSPARLFARTAGFSRTAGWVRLHAAGWQQSLTESL